MAARGGSPQQFDFSLISLLTKGMVCRMPLSGSVELPHATILYQREVAPQRSALLAAGLLFAEPLVGNGRARFCGPSSVTYVLPGER